MCLSASAAAAAQRSNMIRRRLGVGSEGAQEEEPPPASEKEGRCGGMRTLKKRPPRGLEGSLHWADSWGIAATEEAMPVANEGGRKGVVASQPGPKPRMATGRCRTRVRW